MFCRNMSNERISWGDCFDWFLVESDERNAMLARQSLANNDLIIENIFKWLKPSQLIKCAQVCNKWSASVQLLRCKRKFFSHQLLYFLLSPKQTIETKDKDFVRTSLEEIINSLNLFVARNDINEFKIIIIFSKLEYNDLRKLIESHSLPNDCKVIHINCENQIIGTLVNYETPFYYLQTQQDICLLPGISGLFMSRGIPALQVDVYNDSQIFNIQCNSNLKCVLLFHIWRSFYGHFSQLKTDNEYFEHMESLVRNSKQLAFGGVTVDRIAVLDNSRDATKTETNLKCFLDNICCVTFSGQNVSAESFVLDLSHSKIDNYLSQLNNQLKMSSSLRTEKFAFVFSENLRESTLKLTNFLENIRFIGCSGTVHGSDCVSSNINCCGNGQLFFKKGKCILVIVCINKS